MCICLCWRLHGWQFLIQIRSVTQSCPTLCDPWIAAHQASLSITNSRSSLRLTSIESVMPSSHLILCCPLLLLPPVPPSIRVFSNESTLCMKWPKCWSFSFSIIPSKEIPGWATWQAPRYPLPLHKLDSGLSCTLKNTATRTEPYLPVVISLILNLYHQRCCLKSH